MLDIQIQPDLIGKIPIVSNVGAGGYSSYDIVSPSSLVIIICNYFASDNQINEIPTKHTYQHPTQYAEGFRRNIRKITSYAYGAHAKPIP